MAIPVLPSTTGLYRQLLGTITSSVKNVLCLQLLGTVASSVKKKSCTCCLLCLVFLNFNRFSFRSVFCSACQFAAFNMTKRDSQLAELYSPYALRMDSHDADIPMDPITNYTSPPPELPLLSFSSASTSTGTPLFQLPTTLKPGEYRQKNAHTTIFKIFEYGDGPAALRVEEIDSNGYIRKKRLETYFFGIIGHLRDSRGEPMNTERMGTLSTIGELLQRMVWATHTRSCLSDL